MESKIKKAYDRLKEFEMLSEDYEIFRGFFFENLKDDKKDEALELVLMAFFALLKTPGERFNTLLNSVKEDQKRQLLSWLNASLKKAKNR